VQVNSVSGQLDCPLKFLTEGTSGLDSPLEEIYNTIPLGGFAPVGYYPG
jgi:hypothetical protein